MGMAAKKAYLKCCGCGSVSLCCGGRDLQGNLTLTLINPGTGFGCGNTVLTLSQDIDGVWYTSGTVIVEIPGGGGEECVPMTANFRFLCDPGGPVYQLDWYFEYLGTRTPISGWCRLIKASEDCTYPYIATWDENVVECGGFWNGVITFVVEET